MASIIVTSGGPAVAGFLANPVVVGALIALIGGLAAAYITKRSKDQELFLNALNFLTGGTQKRSVGIAIIADYAERRGMRSVAALIFNAQRKHLEDEKQHDTKTSKRSIEKYNYDQMTKIIKYWEENPVPYGMTWLRLDRHSALKIKSEDSSDGAKVETLDGQTLNGTVKIKTGELEIEFPIKSLTSNEIYRSMEMIYAIPQSGTFKKTQPKAAHKKSQAAP